MATGNVDLVIFLRLQALFAGYTRFSLCKACWIQLQTLFLQPPVSAAVPFPLYATLVLLFYYASVSQSVQKGHRLWSHSTCTAQINARRHFQVKLASCKLQHEGYFQTAVAAAAFTQQLSGVVGMLFGVFCQSLLSLYGARLNPLHGDVTANGNTGLSLSRTLPLRLKGKPSFPVPLPGSDLQSAD